jgi:predicted amidohydrolase
MVTRSIENRVFTVTANRIGQESLRGKILKFTGKSQIAHPSGRVLYRAPQDKATLHVMSIDPEEANQKMISNNNHLLRDRRPEFYKTSMD